ncbi:uncharacterized protein LOC118436328 [Folsomia candida]|uniref:uncharacterized protein LOC118436328 n=1 Tax=Folsomia candida TaxID=158441 RepID=UPI001604A3F4|nr:uncharacterized protein LOC118436328 [Folsomia candida]
MGAFLVGEVGGMRSVASRGLMWPLFITTMFIRGIWTLECERQRMVGRHIYSHPSLWNHSINCPSSFQWEWALARICCYDNYDRFYEHPYCCYSEMYKLVVAVGFICLILIGTSFLLFFCWFYNLPHHILYILTFRKFQLNNWLMKARNGPYVDPSFYAKEPFWSRGADAASQLPYPLRPMPPRIFYPAPPTNKFRGWDMGGGEIPLFILASRQFHRNPYSARPQNRTPPILPHGGNSSSSSNNNYGSGAVGNGGDSRRGSLVTLGESSERGSAVEGRRRGSGWRNSGSTSSLTNMGATTTSSGTHNANTNFGPTPTSYGNMGPSSGGNYGSSGGHSTCNNRPNSAEVPFIIPMDEHEAETELREAIRLMDDKVDVDAASSSSSWSIAGDSLGQPTTATIFMTNSSRELVRSESQESNSSWNAQLRYGDDDDSQPQQQRDYHSSIGDNNFRDGSARSNGEAMVGVTRVRFGAKVSVQLLNQQLSNSLGLSLNNLPNIQVIGNFGRDGMETIVEDDDRPYDDEEEMDYSPPGSSSPQESRPSSKKPGSLLPPPPPSAARVVVEEPTTPRISSALDRIVTRARQEVPFRPSLPGAIPENPDDEATDLGDGPASRRRTRLNRRNSAPVNF